MAAIDRRGTGWQLTHTRPTPCYTSVSTENDMTTTPTRPPVPLWALWLHPSFGLHGVTRWALEVTL